MLVRYARQILTRRSLRLAAVVLALLGQAAVTSAALELAKDETSAISHTERSGIDLHHGHNEATCIACTALSLQGTPRVVVERVIPRRAPDHAGTRVTADPGVQFLFSSPSRAPPRVF
ncbi:MAG TPA: hypothetical protein VLJ83_02390 [Gemmatimonadaceae bacterium]|nr:hypothetical protein [Gemmatimonadaceae bacterium]